MESVELSLERKPRATHETKAENTEYKEILKWQNPFILYSSVSSVVILEIKLKINLHEICRCEPREAGRGNPWLTRSRGLALYPVPRGDRPESLCDAKASWQSITPRYNGFLHATLAAAAK